MGLAMVCQTYSIKSKFDKRTIIRSFITVYIQTHIRAFRIKMDETHQNNKELSFEMRVDNRFSILMYVQIVSILVWISFRWHIHRMNKWGNKIFCNRFA